MELVVSLCGAVMITSMPSFDGLVRYDILRYVEDNTYVAVMKRTAKDCVVGWLLRSSTQDRVCILRQDWLRLQYLGTYQEQLKGLQNRTDVDSLIALLNESHACLDMM